MTRGCRVSCALWIHTLPCHDMECRDLSCRISGIDDRSVTLPHICPTFAYVCYRQHLVFALSRVLHMALGLSETNGGVCSFGGQANMRVQDTERKTSVLDHLRTSRCQA